MSGRLAATALALAVVFGNLGAVFAQQFAPTGNPPEPAGLGTAPAPDSGTATSSVEQRQERLAAFNPGAATNKSGKDLAFPEAPAHSASAETRKAYQEALQAYYAYRQAGYEHRLGVFAWHSLSTKLIFVVVVLLVLAGVYFAAIQFHTDLRRRDDTDPETRPDPTEFSLSPFEFTVRSPVLGVIILAISLGFFYLYLIHVYPVRNVF